MMTAKHQPGLNRTKGKKPQKSHKPLFLKHILLIQDLLSCWLQFTDLKPYKEVVFAHTLAQTGLAHSIQLCSWHLKKEKQERRKKEWFTKTEQVKLTQGSQEHAISEALHILCT